MVVINRIYPDASGTCRWQCEFRLESRFIEHEITRMGQQFGMLRILFTQRRHRSEEPPINIKRLSFVLYKYAWNCALLPICASNESHRAGWRSPRHSIYKHTRSQTTLVTGSSSNQRDSTSTIFYSCLKLNSKFASGIPKITRWQNARLSVNGQRSSSSSTTFRHAHKHRECVVELEDVGAEDTLHVQTNTHTQTYTELIITHDSVVATAGMVETNIFGSIDRETINAAECTV